MAKKPPATTALRRHVDQHGSDPRAWSPEQRAQHADLSNAAMREQAGLPADPPEDRR
ncbi:hypothetical protein ACIP98_21090 [Streptomyces sp. NPDC088354]|uniref:hypothetical protein n=1 Tax=Streptomyces sp. NPDC088354 TaxID=3365856 RepID=UPI00380175C9